MIAGMTAALALALTVSVASVASQAPADFSGRWTSDPDPGQAAPAAAAGPPGRGRGPVRGDMGSGWGSTITVTQDDKQLIVEYAFFGRGDLQPPLKFVYALDDSESKNTVMMGRGLQVQTSRTAWAGDTLVITSAYSFTDPQSGKPATAEVKRTLKLESPTSLSIETVYAGVMGGPPTTTRTIYRKI